MYGEVMIDARFLTACSAREAYCELQSKGAKTVKELPEINAAKLFCESSSDSGYDDSSNHDTVETEMIF